MMNLQQCVYYSREVHGYLVSTYLLLSEHSYMSGSRIVIL